MFRTLSCQQNLITDHFSLLNHLKNIDAEDFENQPAISQFLSKKDEGQIAVSINAPNLHYLFRNNHTYGHDDKFDLIRRLKRNHTISRTSCLIADFIRNTSLKQTISDIEKCGYVIRLQYWPETVCDFGRRNLSESGKQTQFMDLLQRPELTTKVRERLRKEIIRKFLRGEMAIVGI